MQRNDPSQSSGCQRSPPQGYDPQFFCRGRVDTEPKMNWETQQCRERQSGTVCNRPLSSRLDLLREVFGTVGITGPQIQLSTGVGVWSYLRHSTRAPSASSPPCPRTPVPPRCSEDCLPGVLSVRTLEATNVPSRNFAVDRKRPRLLRGELADDLTQMRFVPVLSVQIFVAIHPPHSRGK
jgi:hypothetical protein